MARSPVRSSERPAPPRPRARRWAAARARKILVVEMNAGQMVEDVKISTPLHDKIDFFGKPCAMPTPEEILGRIRALAGRGA